MSEDKQPAVNKITKKIGKTTYEVFIYFSKTSRENLQDKILRLIKNDISNSNLHTPITATKSKIEKGK